MVFCAAFDYHVLLVFLGRMSVENACGLQSIPEYPDRTVARLTIMLN